jgi:KDO2-lipid IV(A) lauroyltransferase
MFFVSFYLIRYRRKLVQKNLKNSFPEKTATELFNIEKQFYSNLCDYAVETLKLLTISAEELKRRMVTKNPQAAQRNFSNNQSTIMMASHQFNWEWLLTGSSFVYPTIDFVYQPVKSEFFNKLSLISRTRFGAYAIKRKEVARESIRRHHIVRVIAIVGDQYPGYDRDKKYKTKFLNQDTVFFYGVNQLAILTQYPVFYNEIRKVRRGYYEVTNVPIATPPYAKDSETVIENYVKAVEKLIRENPAEWLWSHNRWKTRHLTTA